MTKTEKIEILHQVRCYLVENAHSFGLVNTSLIQLEGWLYAGTRLTTAREVIVLTKDVTGDNECHPYAFVLLRLREALENDKD